MKQIELHETLIVIGETGSGKTTQIPQFLYDEGYTTQGVIGVTQPRRVAAITLSRRVANEMGVKVGELVGYKVRFEDLTTDQTRIKYMTDGMLLREAIYDQMLTKYSVIVLDEAHERSVNTDVLFGIVKFAQRARLERYRTPLKIIVMSATMDVDHFSSYFNNCQVVYLEGRTHNIRYMNLKSPQTDYLSSCLGIIWDLHQKAPENHDFLVFLTGQDEIEAMASTLRRLAKSEEVMDMDVKMRVFPLYSAMPYQKQNEVFQKSTPNSRKIILATNIAETSITIPGIKYVIDSGMVKLRTHDPVTGIDALKVVRISKAQAMQRAGRAGRESEGFCYRAYTIAEYNNLPPSTTPEILRCNLASVALQLLNLKINYEKFDFIDDPPQEAKESALKQLHRLGAIKDTMTLGLTEIGKTMCRFPLDPQYSRILLAAPEYGCLEDMINIIAMLSTENVFITPNENRDVARERHALYEAKQGDHITLLKIFRAYLGADKERIWCRDNYFHMKHLSFAKEIRTQLIHICERLELQIISCGADVDAIRKCLIVGLFGNIAELQSDREYLTLTGRQRVRIHPTSVFCDKEKPKYIVYSELIATGRIYVRTVSAIEQEWIEEANSTLKYSKSNSFASPRQHGMHALNSAAEQRAGTSGSTSNNDRNSITLYQNNSKTPDPYQFPSTFD